jgi:SPP1 gp7 family putative phage head morphogenesis protein
MHEMTAEEVKDKFGRKRLLKSRVIPRYPESSEREYERVAKQYMGLLNSVLKEHFAGLQNLLQPDIRVDAEDPEEQSVVRTGAEIAAFDTALSKMFEEIGKDFATRQGLFDLAAQLEKLSKAEKKLTIAEWKRVVKRTLGIDIMTDYYNGVKFQQIFDKWVADNVGLIKTIPQETLADMRQIIRDGYLHGSTAKDIAKQIQEKYDVDKNHAVFIARDQTAKLNSDITQAQQEDAGVNEYIWRSMDDNRVRHRHAELNGSRHKYSEPPVVDEKTGRTCNPGQDYNCRCVALPIFDLETVALPWESGRNKK